MRVVTIYNVALSKYRKADKMSNTFLGNRDVIYEKLNQEVKDFAQRIKKRPTDDFPAD